MLCGRPPDDWAHPRERVSCVCWLDAAWGEAVCGISASFTWVYHHGVWFGFVSFALILAVFLCWVDRRYGSWVLLRLVWLHRVTQN